MTGDTGDAKDARDTRDAGGAKAAPPPKWKKDSAEAWGAIANEWPAGGGATLDVDVRRQALLGIFSFLGIEMEEKDLEKMKRADGDAIGDAMTRMEKLLQ
jgi:hypothetical protein